MEKRQDFDAYWKQNLRYVVILLAIWFVVSYVFGILLADALSGIYLGGFRLGFGLPTRGRRSYSSS